MPDLQHETANNGHLGGKKSMPQMFTKADAGIAKLVAKVVVNRPWAYTVILFLKKERTRVAFILTAWCLAEGVYNRERPFDLARPNVWVVIGLFLTASGLAFRLAALGCLRKKEYLATQGIYSLCRHPLYLGSLLLGYGFCTLLADVENFVLATVYFAVFYPLTIFWEEISLAARYGEAHDQYCMRTPILLPLGSFRTGEFTWQAAMSRGGTLLLSAVVVLLASVEVMAEVLLP